MADESKRYASVDDAKADADNLSDAERAEALDAELGGSKPRRGVLEALGASDAQLTAAGFKVETETATKSDAGQAPVPNTEEVAALTTPPVTDASVDATTTANPVAAATEKAAARSRETGEGPIAGTGGHRLAAPAPAVHPGEPAENVDPQRHDARRSAEPIAAPAPTRGPGIES